MVPTQTLKLRCWQYLGWGRNTLSITLEKRSLPDLLKFKTACFYDTVGFSSAFLSRDQGLGKAAYGSLIFTGLPTTTCSWLTVPGLRAEKLPPREKQLEQERVLKHAAVTVSNPNDSGRGTKKRAFGQDAKPAAPCRHSDGSPSLKLLLRIINSPRVLFLLCSDNPEHDGFLCL